MLTIFCLFLIWGVGGICVSWGGTFYLEPDTIYITTGAGVEFELDLLVDSEIQNLKGYEAYIGYNKFVLDTIEVLEGPLTYYSNSYFDVFLVGESTQLLVESVILGGGASVDGPGKLADITLISLDSGGVVDMNLEIIARDSANELMTVNTAGAVAVINAPPAHFDLVTPPHQENLYLDYGENMSFFWDMTYSFYPDDLVRYELTYSADPDFPPGNTTVEETFNNYFSVPVSTLDTGRYYWKVKAINTYGHSIWSDETFHFQLNTYSYPDGFNLIYPAQDEDLLVPITDDLELIWSSSGTEVQGDYIRYNLYYSQSPDFPPEATDTVRALSDTVHTLTAADLSTAYYYWKVEAYNTLGYHTWCSELTRGFDLTIAANPGIFSLLSPIDGVYYNMNSGEGVQLAWSQSVSVIPDDTLTFTIYFGTDDNLPANSVKDTFVVDQLEITLPDDFIPRREIYYWAVKATNRIGYDTMSANVNSLMTYYRGDADGSGAFNILDVTHIINYLYKGGPEPIPSLSADPNCSESINILDVTYIINCLYKSGPAPCWD